MAEQNDQGGSDARSFQLTAWEMLPAWQREGRARPSTWAEVRPELKATARMGWRAVVATDIWLHAQVHGAAHGLHRRLAAFHLRRLEHQRERVQELSVQMIVDATDWRAAEPSREREG